MRQHISYATTLKHNHPSVFVLQRTVYNQTVIHFTGYNCRKIMNTFPISCTAIHTTDRLLTISKQFAEDAWGSHQHVNNFFWHMSQQTLYKKYQQRSQLNAHDGMWKLRTCIISRRSIDWELMALSAQIGYIVPLKCYVS